ncbi:MAG: DUF1540 domain-containing protein [Clostridiales bacterium]|nr:DUF1540 domain-containing protein [Clostridiales bacterium]
MNKDTSRKPLDGVVCSVDTCVFHTKGNRCMADTIAVRMETENPKSKTETLCETFTSKT